jgi:hypothetical protein
MRDEYGETRPVKQGEKSTVLGVRNDDLCVLRRISVSISGVCPRVSVDKAADFLLSGVRYFCFLPGF